MTNRFMRGSAEDRARPADLRQGSFKQGHEKRGGRKRGTPNQFSIDYKKAIFEAVYRVGEDGNGKDGIVGYFRWVAVSYPQIFTVLLSNVLTLEFAESNMPEKPRGTMAEINDWLRDFIGLTSENRTRGQTVDVESQSPSDWTGQPFPVGSLMQTAVAAPASFCKLLAAMFPRPPTKRRRPSAGGGSRPQPGGA
jgi:hypothetical protein